MATKILNKCPLCGDRLAVDLFYLCSKRRHISEETGGLESEVAGMVVDEGRVRGLMISCTNENCDFETDLNCKCKKHPEITMWWQKDGVFYYNASSAGLAATWKTNRTDIRC